MRAGPLTAPGGCETAKWDIVSSTRHSLRCALPTHVTQSLEHLVALLSTFIAHQALAAGLAS
jgi:hypothetical protein